MRAGCIISLLTLVLPVFSAPAAPEQDQQNQLTLQHNEVPSATSYSPPEDACEEICRLHPTADSASERDSLCSEEGLANTLQCAICIDTTWSETTWDDSALAEYERIVEACQKPAQGSLQ